MKRPNPTWHNRSKPKRAKTVCSPIFSLFIFSFCFFMSFNLTDDKEAIIRSMTHHFRMIKVDFLVFERLMSIWNDIVGFYLIKIGISDYNKYIIFKRRKSQTWCKILRIRGATNRYCHSNIKSNSSVLFTEKNRVIRCVQCNAWQMHSCQWVISMRRFVFCSKFHSFLT